MRDEPDLAGLLSRALRPRPRPRRRPKRRPWDEVPEEPGTAWDEVPEKPGRAWDEAPDDGS
jgi:hypothetical protein